ncbi:MAG: DUF302 domain-containing protein [Gammaproteobacteria bacterium]|nr:DUF302 domain-containing protein [Gammaproteobacteria bacterium]MDH5629797.1 DUF302 domain-containing protein [Gammaproteobacteria bacterium]
MIKTRYSFGKQVDLSFNQAIEKVTELLAEQGFGILTEIDASATIKKKIDKDIPPYKILGACNPNFAHKAITNESSIGTLLPCNVLVREDMDGNVIVEFMDPDAILNLVDNPLVEELSSEVRARLAGVLDNL